MARFLVTGALPYSNGRLHVGHIAGAYLPADIYTRYLRSAGHEVRFICGSDDNGVAALNSARKEERPVEELTADYRKRQHKAFEFLGIHFDLYGGTHSFEPVLPDQPDGRKIHELHSEFSSELFRAVHENGYFTKKESEQLFDTQAGQFLPDRYVKGTCPHCQSDRADGSQCEACGKLIEAHELVDPVSTLTGTTPELRKTTHWYLRLQDIAEALRGWLDSRPRTGEKGATADGRIPWRSFVVNQTLGMIDKVELKERSMTRDLDWGVKVPLDDPEAEGKVLYVWFDAPIGYVTFTAVDALRRGEGPDGWKRWWQDPETKIVHFIGEDNIVFHALTWPAVLLASRARQDAIAGLDPDNLDGSGYQIPAAVCANAYLNFVMPSGEEVKQSKSQGTAVFIDRYAEALDADPLRYYLTAVAPESARSAFEWKDFFTRNNSELVAAIGNFANRYQKILTKFFERRVPAVDEGTLADETKAFLGSRQAALDEVAQLIENFEFKRGLERAMQFGRDCNGYIDARKPWLYTNEKKELPDKPKGEVNLVHAGETIWACLQATRTLGVLLSPFLPHTGEKIRALLGLHEAGFQWSAGTTPLPAGHALSEPTMLFKKLDPDTAFTS